jgi:glycosyltransferase involved in cell wall biosynthesis
MKILFSLTYYRPHMSGLTIYVQNLAEALVERGHKVTVLAAQHDPALPRKEVSNGVNIIRVPTQFWISKGAIMMGYPMSLLPHLRAHDVAVINLPNTFVETLALCTMARLMIRRPIVATYHCDLSLPPGLFNRIVDRVVFSVNMIAAALVDQIVAYTEDFASRSHVLSRFPAKTQIILPPVTVPIPEHTEVEKFRREHAPSNEPLIGFAGRIASEKGVEYLLEALLHIHKVMPNARLLFAGDYENVIGEESYWQFLQPLLEPLIGHYTFLGRLDPKRLATFYEACDVIVLPSINNTETFGFVQIESMLCGTPVVASDLPGVRIPVQMTGMGMLVPPRDAVSLAKAVIEVLKHRQKYIQPREVVEQLVSPDITTQQYEALFRRLLNRT